MDKSLLYILKDEFKLDFTQTLILRTGGSGFDVGFELTPRDFLRYAKTDYSENGDKGLINSLTNVKRAIDCQIDVAFTFLGIKYDDLKDIANELIKTREDIDQNLPFKLKLITALDIAPSGLVSQAREFRNKLEHYYKRPIDKEVKESIELAELFILAVESKTKIIEDGFLLTDKANFKGTEKDIGHFVKYENFLIVELLKDKINLLKNSPSTNELIESINQDSAEFYFFIRMMNNLRDTVDCKNSLKDLLKYIEHPIPSKHVKLDFQE